MPGIDDSRQFIPLKIAVLTVSDTRELADDKSGSTLVERVRAAGHAVAERAIVKDDVETIRAHVKTWIADEFLLAIHACDYHRDGQSFADPCSLRGLNELRPPMLFLVDSHSQRRALERRFQTRPFA